jgi:uncharacterized Rmd1/YagE family protein
MCYTKAFYRPKKIIMECVAYCTASSYDTKALITVLRQQYIPSLHRDVIHVDLDREGEGAHVFYFPYGTTVCWGLTSDEEQHFLALASSVQDGPLDKIEKDYFAVSLGEKAQIVTDEIIVPTRDAMTLLALSHGIAQSVKLEAFETQVQKTYNECKHIPQALARKGKIPLSRKEIRRKMGQLFLERSSINLQWDVLDTPEFFWENLDLEPLYNMVSNFLDIQNRVAVLNQRLDIVHELFEMLGNELNHQHSSRLEWTIIGLIVIEVVLTLLRDVFNII